MVQVASEWEFDVERGPDWLFVRPRAPEAAELDTSLAEHVWSMLEQNFCNRLVLELDNVNHLRSYLVGQLVWLHKRIMTHGGLMRISGLSDANQEVLHQCRLDDRFPQFHNREEAVMCSWPLQPR